MQAAAGLAVALVAMTLHVQVASAVDRQVTATGDGPSTCPSPSSCTLRGAITQSNAGPGGDVVLLPPGAYRLGANPVQITKSVRLVGTAGAGSTEIVQLTAGKGVFEITATAADVGIDRLTISNSSTDGSGTVAANGPRLTLTNDVFSQNKTAAPGGGFAGAVYVGTSGAATLQVTDTSFISNGAGSNGTNTVSSGQGSGGAIYFGPDEGTLVVARSVFAGNSAGGNGGVGVSSGQGGGGAIYASAGSGPLDATIENSAFTGNRAGGNGGAGISSGQGSGGAISWSGSEGSSLRVAGNTFAGNQAGGAPGAGGSSGQGAAGAMDLDDGGTVQLVNNTFSNNSAPGGVGGTLYTTSTPTSLVNNTIVGGKAGTGGNIYSSGGTTSARNTIVAGGEAPSGSNCSGLITSLGSNIEDASTCSFGPPADPLLEALAGNGGPTQTMALKAGSPARDGADSASCPPTDQRGALRPAGAACDIGAFEVATAGATTGEASGISSTTATLNGTAFNPDVAGASAYFEYGTTTGYGAATPVQLVGATAAAAPVTASLTGLAPSTQYHGRLVVGNALGTSFGADRTFTTAPAPAAGPDGSSAAAPVLAALKLRPARLRAETGRGASIAGSRRVRGARVTYRNDSAATTTFSVQRPRLGYRSGRRCVAKRPRRVRKPRRCRFYKTVGSFQHVDVAGANSFRFTGRVKRRPLRPGRYRLKAVSRQGTGKRSKALNASFRVVR